MSLTELEPDSKQFKITKQYFLNKNLNDKKYLIYDGGQEFNLKLNCNECKKTEFNFDLENLLNFEKYRLKFAGNKLKSFGGGGIKFKLLQCDDCNTILYFGIGYDEPNYGRNQYFIHTILKLEEIQTGRKDFYGNMGEPSTAQEYFSKYGVYPPNYDRNGKRIKK